MSSNKEANELDSLQKNSDLDCEKIINSENSSLNIARESLECAEICFINANYGRAFAHYLLALKLDPTCKSAIKDNFTMALREWSEKLEKNGQLADMFNCYEQACMLFPECEMMLNNIGAQLFRLGYCDEASSFFRRALRINPDFLGARENLENVCGFLVERWHFNMLNDHHRNMKYNKAISKAIHMGFNHVLDIGIGTGLLSMMAVEAGAKSVYGCEMSRTMFDVSKDVLKSNNMEDKIKVIHKKSTDLLIPEDLPEKISLVVTETFDAGLLGEHILSSLQHAWKHLLNIQLLESKKASVIPCGATVYICAIECKHILKENRLLYPCIRYLNFDKMNIISDTGVNTCNIDNSQLPYWNQADIKMSGENKVPLESTSVKECSSQEDQSTNLNAPFSKHVDNNQSFDFDPYTTERLSSINGGYKKLTDVIPVLKFNFNNLQEIDWFLNGVTSNVEIPVIENGRVDAIAMWFDLHLDPETTISSAPDTESCWEQAIYPVLPNHITHNAFKDTLSVQKADRLKINYSCKDDLLVFKCIDILHSFSNEGGTTMKKSVNSELKEYHLDRLEIRRLNDIDYNASMCRAIHQRQQELPTSVKLSLLDMSESFSPLSLQAIKIGAEESCITESNPRNQELICALASNNGIEGYKLRFSTGDFELEAENSWSILLTELIDIRGCLHQRILENLAMARVTCMHPSGFIIPDSITVYGIVIDSDTLENLSRVVDDDRTLGYLISDHINSFEMSTHLDIDFHMLKHKKLSESFEIFTLNFNDDKSTIESDCAENVLPAFLQQETNISLVTVDSGNISAVVYWFDLYLTSTIKLCTLDPKLHWKQAAVMQKGLLQVPAHSNINIRAVLKNSCINISVTCAS